MADVVLFAGTCEGRELAMLLREKGIPTLACVATGYGGALLPGGGSLRIHTGRLDEKGMTELLRVQRPKTVIDATHPYAEQVSRTIRTVCGALAIGYLRVRREPLDRPGCLRFPSLDGMVEWLNTVPGVVFSTLGAKEAAALSKVRGFEERVWMRILPLRESLDAVQAAGFPSGHIICMRGPFSRELNEAMFRAAGAAILLTKDSGAAGGLDEKLAAADACGMTAALLSRPDGEDGLTLDRIKRRIEENGL